MDHLIAFKNLIKQKTGLSFEYDRSAKLSDTLKERMIEKGLVNPNTYYALLLDDSAEFSRLITLLTIKETYFFREPAHLKLFSERLASELLRLRNPGERVRILSAGCATGEEAYSLAITLMEKYGPCVKSLFSILAADIDSEAVLRAKKGHYGPSSFRSIESGIKEKYFEKAGPQTYAIKPCIRELVEFHSLNLLSRPYPALFQGMDLIFYRNVSIYFDPETRKMVFTGLSRILNEQGYLFVSSTEVSAHDTGKLPLVELDGVFLFQKDSGRSRETPSGLAAPGRFETAAKPAAAPEQAERRVFSTRDPVFAKAAAAFEKEQRAAEREKEAEALFNEALALARARNYPEALEATQAALQRAPSLMKAYTLRANILVNLKRADEAEAVCLEAIRIDSLCLEAYLLLALISRIRKDDESAIRRLKEAIYVQSSCWLAHFYLAELYASRKEFGPACREYGIVVKQLEGGTSDTGLDLFPLAIPVEQMVQACRQKRDKLQSERDQTRQP